MLISLFGHHLTTFTFTQLWDWNEHTSWDCVIWMIAPQLRLAALGRERVVLQHWPRNWRKVKWLRGSWITALIWMTFWSPCIWVLGRSGVRGVDWMDWVRCMGGRALRKIVMKWWKRVDLISIEEVLEGRRILEIGYPWTYFPINCWDLHILKQVTQVVQVGLLGLIWSSFSNKSVVIFGDIFLRLQLPCCHIEQLVRHRLYLGAKTLLETSQRVTREKLRGWRGQVLLRWWVGGQR